MEEWKGKWKGGIEGQLKIFHTGRVESSRGTGKSGKFAFIGVKWTIHGHLKKRGESESDSNIKAFPGPILV